MSDHHTFLRTTGMRTLARARTQRIDLVGDAGPLTALVRRMIERILEVELGWHLGYGRYQFTGRGSGNSRNGSTRKTLVTDLGRVAVEVPRDRAGTFRTQLILKHSRQLQGAGEGVLRMFARPPVLADVTAALFGIFPPGSEDALVEKVGTKLDPIIADWRVRPLPVALPAVLVDALDLPGGPIGFAVGIGANGRPELLGLCELPAHRDAAAAQHAFLTHLLDRGLADVGVCCYGATWAAVPAALARLWPRAAARPDLTAVVAPTVPLASPVPDVPPPPPAVVLDEGNLRTCWPVLFPG